MQYFDYPTVFYLRMSLFPNSMVKTSLFGSYLLIRTRPIHCYKNAMKLKVGRE